MTSSVLLPIPQQPSRASREVLSRGWARCPQPLRQRRAGQLHQQLGPPGGAPPVRALSAAVFQCRLGGTGAGAQSKTSSSTCCTLAGSVGRAASSRVAGLGGRGLAVGGEAALQPGQPLGQGAGFPHGWVIWCPACRYRSAFLQQLLPQSRLLSAASHCPRLPSTDPNSARHFGRAGGLLQQRHQQRVAGTRRPVSAHANAGSRAANRAGSERTCSSCRGGSRCPVEPSGGRVSARGGRGRREPGGGRRRLK